MNRLHVTSEAKELILDLRKKYGEIIFHQSGGCCDGTVPMCFPKDDFLINDQDVLLGEIGDCPYYMSKDQYKYWEHSKLTIDIAKGRGSGFSLESGTGYRFVIHSTIVEPL